MRSQPERRNLITPSSNSPSQWHPTLLPHSALQVDFLACGCAWVFEIGKNHLRLCIVDSDGSIDKDTLLVSASVDVSSFMLSARSPAEGYRFIFPSSQLHVPNYLRAGPSSVQIPQCFPYDPPFYSTNNQTLSRDLSGFDDARLFKNYSEDLSIKLHVRLEMQRKASAPLLESQGTYTISIFIWQSSIFLRSYVLRYRKPTTWVNHH